MADHGSGGSERRNCRHESPTVHCQRSPVGRVTLTLHGPISELAAALRTLADGLDQEQASSTVTYTATVAPQARGPAPGGMTTSFADPFVARLTSAAAEVPVVLCGLPDRMGTRTCEHPITIGCLAAETRQAPCANADSW
jgi:hypothetical protein